MYWSVLDCEYKLRIPSVRIPSVTLGPDDFPDTTESPESEASKRARHRMNWQDESDDDLNDYLDEV